MKIQQLNENTYLLKEACFCYLLVGSEKAMLIDCGAGTKDLRPTIRKIIGTKELIVVLTHGHLDHFGGGRFFEKIHIPKADLGIYHLQNSEVLRKWALNRFPFFVRPFRKMLREKNPENVVWFDDESVFELGGRRIEVLSTPGHTPGSVCYMDRKNRLFFCGDTLSSWGILLNLDYSEPPEVFRRSQMAIKDVIGDFDRILPGHHRIDIEKILVDDYICLTRKAENNEGEYASTEFGLCRIATHRDLILFYKICG